MTTRADLLTSPSAPRLDAPVQPGLEGIDQLLRRPVWFVSAAAAHAEPGRILRALILTVLAGAAVFGAAMGVFRPGPQIVSSMVKLPLVLLLTAGLTVPAYTAARWATGAKADVRQDILLFVATLALVSLVLAALAPVVLLSVLTGFGYHAIILVVVTCAGLAGLVGVIAFVRATPRGTKLATTVAALVFALVGTQMAWTLRPFVARPRADFAIVRSVEGSFLDAVHTSAESARGRYHRDAAPVPESW